MNRDFTGKFLSSQGIYRDSSPGLPAAYSKLTRTLVKELPSTSQQGIHRESTGTQLRDSLQLFSCAYTLIHNKRLQKLYL
jgi:hypothetical protein